ncbi:MAG: hypothetical protein JWO94_952, partial [Verrucomicrobiaceae bacterium]|nr:hypothetical protein [Verrucomicrobiaceae bacterium]
MSIVMSLAGSSFVPAALPSVGMKAVSVGELQAPTCVTHAGDGSGRIFVCEQRGQIRVIQNGMLLPQVFLDLASKMVPFPPTDYFSPMNPAYEERGLLGLAFHPGFSTPSSPGYQKFYVFYSAPSPNARGNPASPATTPPPVDCRTTISEFQVGADARVALPGSERVLLSFDKPQFNHNGGQLEFGPDGFLYFSTGDGGGANDINPGHTGATNPQSFGNLGNAQDTTSLLGKIHRIDPLGTNAPGGQYGIPASNPFVGAGNGVREEIYAYGLRNVWRFSFDSGTGGSGKLFAADVGQNKVEEIDIIAAGGNYGWHAREGSFSLDTAVESALISGGSVRIDGGTRTLSGGAVLTDPIAQYAHPGVTMGSPALPNLGTSITGGYRYRGTAIPALAGKYVFGDYNFGAINSGTTQGTLLGIEEKTPNVWSTPAPITVAGTNPLLATHVMAFGRDEQGEIYVATEAAQGPRNDPDTNQPTGAIYKIIAATMVTQTITAKKDNTIFSEDDASNYHSDALGYLYVGKTGPNYGPYVRRALVSFDVAGALPAGVSIQSAQFRLKAEMMAASASGSVLSINRLTQTWGEGTSHNTTGGSGAPATIGDATWTRTFYNTNAWSTPGGSYVPTASATAAIATTGPLTWNSTVQTVADVQSWLDNPSSNGGWIVRGDEINSKTAIQFHSVQQGNTPPALIVTYPGLAAPNRRESWL